ncbi:uncharacterized protein TRIVIDRAFT_227912 [Trichoderma virens Gv29-8]|uniref:DNA/RNA-binding domain-containing protein n=1 Tax=Hypocrea virens (strain Gv29-8 / FGSC 10586) TaxID=413071 RepID=G9NAX1_HYPVG|nr:uncharacterized protein TRIVIDRAFT_227912 [Trichoderma virens Gv29-8]EHK15981.1 hypothetical protein TRIVIDRAFT_227912 [Trichoderma virens Gv29-8]UKZ56246.1 hypothetical protein TrVGV298_010079 [Trichoderma virens]
MVIADKCFSLSIGPLAGEPAKSFYLGSRGDICNAGRLGLDGNFPRLSSQALFFRESSADDTLSAASVAAVCDGAAAVACGCDIASAASHNSRHDIPGSTEERSSSRRFAASHSCSWTATIADAPSNFAAGSAKSLTKADAFSHIPSKGPEKEKKEKQHCASDANAEMALQKTNQSQAPALSDLERLTNEVKGIYAGLVMVETKCIEVDNAQIPEKELIFAPNNNKSNNKNNNSSSSSSSNMQALIALHSTLLHEHHDFFLASQHPAASPALQRLAAKYAMPARMWRHGIHSFLELLRHSLPDSMEHMLTFIYMAYSMMAPLYETVPASADTWIECLGDLGRYRMAIEDDDIWNREIWTTVARPWYYKPPPIFSMAGRLYHHLAILARPNPLQQLFYYFSTSNHLRPPFIQLIN